jgi:hypothetical protein
MEDQNGWKHLEKHLLAPLARARWAGLHGLGLRDECKCVLDAVYRIGLHEGSEGQLPGHIRGWSG